MNEVIQNAIETVDGARHHKCELEGRLAQLVACLSQVTVTSERARDEIKSHFADLQSKILQQIALRSKELIDRVNGIEKDALEPLKECKIILQEGIQEAALVVENGESLLRTEDDINSVRNVKKLNKFTNMASGPSLDSVPEVPSMTEVACVSFHFDEEEFSEDICSAIKRHGHISKRAPVQITEINQRPGGMLVSWDETDAESSMEWIESGNTVLYRLQYCQGKVDLVSHGAGSPVRFRDVYVGQGGKHAVKKLLPNTVYTFRVGRSFVTGSDPSAVKLIWSPWSVYQDSITTLPGYGWENVKGHEGYTLQDDCRIAIKNSNLSRILYSKGAGYVVGYPLTFNLLVEGKSRSLGDGFALVAKEDTASNTIIRDGTLCVSADGRIFISGTESRTRFPNFCRNTAIRFLAKEHQSDTNAISKEKRSRVTTLRVSITVSDKEAVFDWQVPSSCLNSSSSSKSCLIFAAAFKSSGWKFSVI